MFCFDVFITGIVLQCKQQPAVVSKNLIHAKIMQTLIYNLMLCHVTPNYQSQLRSLLLTAPTRQPRRNILIRRDIKRRIPCEEVRRRDMQLQHLNRHHRPILHARIMRESKDAPAHNILIQHIIASISCVAHSADLTLTQQRVPPTGKELVVLVLGHPEVLLGEQGAFGLCAVGVGEEELCWGRCDLVTDWFTRYAV